MHLLPLGHLFSSSFWLSIRYYLHFIFSLCFGVSGDQIQGLSHVLDEYFASKPSPSVPFHCLSSNSHRALISDYPSDKTLINTPLCIMQKICPKSTVQCQTVASWPIISYWVVLNWTSILLHIDQYFVGCDSCRDSTPFLFPAGPLIPFLSSKHTRFHFFLCNYHRLKLSSFTIETTVEIVSFLFPSLQHFNVCVCVWVLS